MYRLILSSSILYIFIMIIIYPLSLKVLKSIVFTILKLQSASDDLIVSCVVFMLTAINTIQYLYILLPCFNR